MTLPHPALSDPPDSSDAAVLAATRHWLEAAVIGFQLCPFARPVHLRGQIRWTVSAARDIDDLAAELAHELQILASADPQRTDTTLLIVPHLLQDFLDFNDFLDLADDVLAELGLEGELQVASFHPQFQFAEEDPDDVSQASNRSPWPILHLLREDSVARALEAHPEAEHLAERNVQRLRTLGWAGWQALYNSPAPSQ